MAASELSHKIHMAILSTNADQPYATVAIDEALAPVRECLEGLRQGGCWCGVTPASDDEIMPAVFTPHSDACEAARVVYESLQIKD